MIFLPPWVPLNVYDFACWARQTVVALSVVLSYRPVRPFSFGLEELRGSEPWQGYQTASAARARAWSRSTSCCTCTSGGRCGGCASAALARAERWIIDRQEADGSWGGIQPPWVYSLIALHLRGYPLDHPVMARGLAGLERFTHRGARPSAGSRPASRRSGTPRWP